MVSGYVHGGGGLVEGTLRDSFDEAKADLQQDRFMSGYSDTLACVEAIPTCDAEEASKAV